VIISGTGESSACARLCLIVKRAECQTLDAVVGAIAVQYGPNAAMGKDLSCGEERFLCTKSDISATTVRAAGLTL